MSIFACSLLPLHALGLPQELHYLSFFSDVHDYFNEGDKGKEKNPKKIDPFCKLLLHKVSFFLLVTLVYPCDHQGVAKGTIIKRDLVHGYSYYGSDETTEFGEAVTEEEVAISIEEILSPHEIKQPLYNYELNAGGGGVTSWEAASCLCKCF